MNLESYNAARESVAWRDCSHFGRFVLRGRDAGALLHHLTTNSIKPLRAGRALEAALLSSKARLLDWLSIARVAGAQGDEWRVITSPNRREQFEPHARRFVLFRQEVSIQDVTDSTALFALRGPQVLAGREAGVVRALEGGCEWLSPRLPRGAWSWRDAVGGSEPEGAQVDGETFNVLRVEAGIPVAGAEVTEDFNPWEANFDASISLSKGCYNGQEVVARLHSYAKIKQRLRGLIFSQPLDASQLAGVALKRNGKAAGRVSSAVMSPRLGLIALAYVREDAFEAGASVQVLAGEEQAEVEARMVELPFEV